MAKRQPRRAKAPNDIVALARAHTQAAIDTLVEIMTGADAPPATRLSAANALLERAFGKPAQPEDDGRDVLKPAGATGNGAGPAEPDRRTEATG